MLISLHPDNPQVRNLKIIAECLNDGGVIIYPTDTVYGLGCDITHNKAIGRIAKIKNIDVKKAQFSFVCADLSHLSDYTRSVSNPIFRLLKQALPGPYTFILEANKAVPKLLKTKRDTVGIRVPDHIVTQMILAEMSHPIISTSLPNDEDEEVGYYTDAELIDEKFGQLVDLVVDSGPGGIRTSTIIDCSRGTPELIRAGLGEYKNLLGISE